MGAAFIAKQLTIQNGDIIMEKKPDQLSKTSNF